MSRKTKTKTLCLRVSMVSFFYCGRRPRQGPPVGMFDRIPQTRLRLEFLYLLAADVDHAHRRIVRPEVHTDVDDCAGILHALRLRSIGRTWLSAGNARCHELDSACHREVVVVVVSVEHGGQLVGLKDGAESLVHLLPAGQPAGHHAVQRVMEEEENVLGFPATIEIPSQPILLALPVLLPLPRDVRDCHRLPYRATTENDWASSGGMRFGKPVA